MSIAETIEFALPYDPNRNGSRWRTIVSWDSHFILRCLSYLKECGMEWDRLNEHLWRVYCKEEHGIWDSMIEEANNLDNSSCE